MLSSSTALLLILYFADANRLCSALPLHGDSSRASNIQIINAENLGLSFVVENQTGDNFGFKVLLPDEKFILIAGRNIVYNISADKLQAVQSLSWVPSQQDVQMCNQKGKSASECQNFIRILAKNSSNTLLVCGTNAYKPKCRHYVSNGTEYRQIGAEFDGAGLSPYGAQQTFASVYDAQQGNLYSATVADFAGVDPLIYRRKTNGNDFGLRTERSDAKCLSDPYFSSAFIDGEEAYFWFRENAVENFCGKAFFSRVGRVCRKDRGSRGHRDTFTTFLKARLNCSIPGDYPFYFDRIESTSNLIDKDASSKLVYAIFSTVYRSPSASAVCAFDMKTIRDIFNNGDFKFTPLSRTSWSPVLSDSIDGSPGTRPGQCVDDTQSLSEDNANFAKEHPIMDDAVPNFYAKPLLIQPAERGLLTKIAIDQVRGADGTQYDVVFTGTEKGTVLKTVVVANKSGHAIEEVQVLSRSTVQAIAIHREQLLVLGIDTLKSLPLHHCYKSDSCAQCVRLRDPYCAWDLRISKCSGQSNGNWNDSDYAQDVSSGISSKCPAESNAVVAATTTDSALTDLNSAKHPMIDSSYGHEDAACRQCTCNGSTDQSEKRNNEISTDSGDFLQRLGNNNIDSNKHGSAVLATPNVAAAGHTSETLLGAVMATMAVALLLGMFIGYRCHASDFMRRKIISRSSSLDTNHKHNTLKKNAVAANGTLPHQKSAGDGLSPAPIIDAFKQTPKFNGQCELIELPPQTPPPPTPSPPYVTPPPSFNMVVDFKMDTPFQRSNSGEHANNCGNDSLNGSNAYCTLPRDYKVRKQYI